MSSKEVNNPIIKKKPNKASSQLVFQHNKRHKLAKIKTKKLNIHLFFIN